MSQKNTRAQIIKERLCGLKLLDAAVAKAGMNAVIEKTISIHNKCPEILPDEPWERLSWAASNAVKEILEDWNKCVSANPDEMFDESQIKYIAVNTGLDKYPYTLRKCHKRKKS